MSKDLNDGLIVSIPFIGAIVTLTVFVDEISNILDIPQPTNQVTLTVEISIGIFLAILIYLFSEKRQKEMNRTIKKIDYATDKINKLISKQQSIELQNKIFFFKGLLNDINGAKSIFIISQDIHEGWTRENYYAFSAGMKIIRDKIKDNPQYVNPKRRDVLDACFDFIQLEMNMLSMKNTLKKHKTIPLDKMERYFFSILNVIGNQLDDEINNSRES